MSEHAWTLENMEAYLAGGLDAAETLRLEAHSRDCAPCALALDGSRRLDSRLSALFFEAHPAADLEDRTIRALRTGRETIPVLSTGWKKRLLIAAGVAAVLAGGGYIGSHSEDMPMPGDFKHWEFAKRNSAPAQSPPVGDINAQVMSGLDPLLKNDLTNEDLGLQSDLKAALPNTSIVDKQTVDATVTNDNLGQPNAPYTDTAALKLPGVPSSNGQAGGGQDKPGQDVLIIRGTSRTQQSTGQGLGYTGLNFLGVGNLNFLQPTYANPYFSGELSKNDIGKGDVKGKLEKHTSMQLPDYVNQERMLYTEGKPDDKESMFRMGLNQAEQKGTGLPGASAPVPPPSVPPAIPPAEAGPRNIVIRSGEIEFVIDSFDVASATVTKLVNGIKGAFISTINSDKLVNGKVKGSITVRVPPEHLDGLIVDLRKELGKVGELKGVRIGSQDITKQYTDLESRLKAARTMEQRLLQIIKEGKGEIKQLLEAEKELGVWRTRIEEVEGELRYYSNLVSLSTLTISLTEKEIRAAADIRESERVQAGLEVEDVDKTYQQLLALIAELKGRVTKSDLKQLAAGQFSATLHFEVAPEQGGPVRDRFRQLGRLARLEIDRVQRPEGAVTKNAKLERGDTEFFLQIYNLANIAPRETAIVHVAVTDVPTAFRSLRDAIGRTSGRVLMAQLNENDLRNISAQFDFDVPRSNEDSAKSAIDSLGDVIARQVTRSPEAENVTDAKVLHRVTLVSASQLKPRDQTILNLEVADVDQTVVRFRAEADEAKGRLVDSQVTRDQNGRRTAKLVYEVPLGAGPGLVEQFKKAGAVRTYQSSRDSHVPDGKFATARLEITLATLVTASKPREQTVLSLEVSDVDQTVVLFRAEADEAKGRLADSQFTRDQSGRRTAKLVYEVPLAAASGLIEQFNKAGTVRVYQSSRDSQVPDSKSATARLEVTLISTEQIVSSDDGLWPKVRRGLSYSASVLLTSITWVVFGLCVVLPWAILTFLGFRLIRWLIRTNRPASPASTSPVEG